MGGIDSLLSTVMMPPGVPVATVAVGKSGAKNSAILAIQILATSNDELQQKLVNFKEDMKNEVLEKNAKLNS
jgi:phosphoribosylaminoimidazole carboxylase PurE protein